MMDSRVSADRYVVADDLENEKLEIKKEIEKLMRQYAKISGYKVLGRRANKVGKAPNDWKKLR